MNVNSRCECEKLNWNSPFCINHLIAWDFVFRCLSVWNTKRAPLRGGFKSYLSKSIYKLEVSKPNSSQRMFIINFSIVICERIYKSFDAGVNNKIIPIKTQFRPKCICLRPQGSEGNYLHWSVWLTLSTFTANTFSKRPREWGRGVSVFIAAWRKLREFLFFLLPRVPRLTWDIKHVNCIFG